MMMRFIVAACSLVCALGARDGGYGGGEGGGYGGGGGGGYEGNGVTCSGKKIPDANGECVDPDVLQNVFVYKAATTPAPYVPRPYVPKPKVEYNVLYVRTPEQAKAPEPLIVPPPQQRTLVYVLTKNGETEQQVIEIPAGPGQTPQVFYVNYDEGDNPTLGGGLTLQEVLSQQGQQGQVVGGGGGGGGGFEGGAGGGGFGGGAGGGGFGGGAGGVGGGGGVYSPPTTTPAGPIYYPPRQNYR